MSHLQSFWKSFSNKESSVPRGLNIASTGFRHCGHYQVLPFPKGIKTPVRVQDDIYSLHQEFFPGSHWEFLSFLTQLTSLGPQVPGPSFAPEIIHFRWYVFQHKLKHPRHRLPLYQKASSMGSQRELNSNLTLQLPSCETLSKLLNFSESRLT